MTGPVHIRRRETKVGRWDAAFARPDAALSRQVFGYTSVVGKLDVDAERYLPSGEAAILVNFGEAYLIASPDGEVMTVGNGEAVLMGAHARPFRTLGAGDKLLALVRLSPSAAHRLVRAHGRDLADRWTRIADHDRLLAADLADAGRLERDWAGRFAALDRRLGERLQDAPWTAAAAAWAQLRRRSGQLSIAALVEAAGLSHRAFIAKFRVEIGHAPKTAARLARFNRVLRRMRQLRRAADADFALEAGYADQAHMIGEFKRFADATPRQVVAMSAGFTLREPSQVKNLQSWDFRAA
jgi:AraC-like DNA-binding protein